MKTYKQLVTEKQERDAASSRQFMEELDAIQAECQHTERTGWLAGFREQVRQCKMCGLVLERERIEWPVEFVDGKWRKL